MLDSEAGGQVCSDREGVGRCGHARAACRPGLDPGVGDLATAGPTCAAAERRVATCVRVRGRRSGAEAFAQGLREPGGGGLFCPLGLAFLLCKGRRGTPSCPSTGHLPLGRSSEAGRGSWDEVTRDIDGHGDGEWGEVPSPASGLCGG